MQLSPEERRKVYNEEKARIEAEQKQRMTEGGSSTGLEPNVAGLLCYLGGWISGIVFLVIEQKKVFPAHSGMGIFLDKWQMPNFSGNMESVNFLFFICFKVNDNSSGGGGIRTHGPLAGHGFPSRWNKPLSDSSLNAHPP